MGLMNTAQTVTDQVLRTWGTQQVSRLKAAFGQGGHGSRGGSNWPARKTFAGHPLLLKTGTLRNGTAVSFASQALYLSNNVKYAKFHQYGTSRLPIRRVVEVTNQDLQKLKTELKTKLEAALQVKVNVL